MMVTGELTEKLQRAIEEYIIPELQQTVLLPYIDERVEKEAQTKKMAEQTQATDDDKPPVCTFVFDREAYEPGFFERLRKAHRIAILTYRKNVKDRWPAQSFKTVEVTVLEQIISMRLCEQETVLGGITFREIRRLTDGGHQTAIITNNRSIAWK